MQQPSTPQITFDEYVGMCGAAAAWGPERMCGYYRVDPAAWASIQRGWASTTAQNPQFAGIVEQEAARLRMGGQPRVVSSLTLDQLGRGAAQVGSALGSFFGAAFDGVAKAVAPLAVGATVMVHWSDGQRYPGTVAQIAPGQYLVTMQNGQQHWVAASFVSLP